MTSIVNMSNDFIIKILTLGDSCVGKTSIILRYTKTPFPKIALCITNILVQLNYVRYKLDI